MDSEKLTKEQMEKLEKVGFTWGGTDKKEDNTQANNKGNASVKSQTLAQFLGEYQSQFKEEQPEYEKGRRSR